MCENSWFLSFVAIAAVIGCLTLIGWVLKMLDIKALQDEVDSELAKEERERAKKALVKIQRDIANAEQIVANLKRQKDDLIASIGDGTF